MLTQNIFLTITHDQYSAQFSSDKRLYNLRKTASSSLKPGVCQRAMRTVIITLSTILLLLQQVTLPALADALQASLTKSNKVHINQQGEPVDLSQLFPDYQARCFFLNIERASNSLTAPGSQLLSLLELDTLGLYLINTATELNPAICFENRLDGTHGYYDYKYNAVVLQESIDIHQQSIILVHELRHLEQVINNFGVTTEYDIDETARVRFAVEADAQAISTLFAWRLRDKGIEWAWTSLTELEKYRDISAVFENNMYQSGSEEDALLVAFRQWYASDWRVSAYYMDAKTQYLDLLYATKLIRQYKALPTNYFDQLCKLPDGRNYQCNTTAEILKNPRSMKPKKANVDDNKDNRATNTLLSNGSLPEFEQHLNQ